MGLVSRDRESAAMNQACVILLLALGGSVLATLGFAWATACSRVAPVRLIGLLSLGMMPVFYGYVGEAASFRINLTSSMPIGIYRVVVMNPRSARVGMLVAVCVPEKAAEIAQRRGYLVKGACAHKRETLLKQVVAVGGDEVIVTVKGLVVDGRLLPNSTALVADHADHVLAAWPVGRQRVADGMLWVYANHRRSWDSRYWGPVPVSNVVALVEPVLVAGGEL
jgi:conjugative transfer signal peptidase TraF